MPCIYYLVFLLALLSLSTLTTAEQYGGAAALDDRALTDRFCMRGRRSKLHTTPSPPSKSTEKSLEKTSDAAMQETTVEPEKLSEDEEGKVAMKNSKEIRFEDKAADDEKMTEQKKEEANKYKPAASPFKPKGSNYYDLEDMN